jgi:hypothetical protein
LVIGIWYLNIEYELLGIRYRFVYTKYMNVYLTWILSLLGGVLFGFVYRSLLKLIKKKMIQKRAKQNIGVSDRFVRAGIGISLLAVGIFSKNEALLFFSGFCFFEAAFSWCGFYAILGKSSCPIN